MSTANLPGAVRWARRLCVFFGVVYALSAAAFAIALVALPSLPDGRIRDLWPVGVAGAFSAYGFLWAAAGTRERSVWGWRAGIGAYSLLIAVDLAAIAGGRRFGVNTLLMLIGLSTLLTRTTRNWFNASEQEIRATEVEERNIRRAQRRLSEEAPSLWDISLKGLPRKDHHRD